MLRAISGTGDTHHIAATTRGWMLSGPDPTLAIADERGTVLGHPEALAFSMAAEASRNARVLTYAPGEFALWRLPSREPEATLEVPVETAIEVLGGSYSPSLCGYGDGWVCVGDAGEVALVHAAPLRLQPLARARTEDVDAAAVDLRTRRLLLGGGQTVEVYDLERGASERLVPLGHTVGHYMAAGGGRAWIVLEDGTLLVLDIATGAASTPGIPVPPGNDTAIDLSASGDTLAVCTRGPSSGESRERRWPVTLRVFAVRDGEPSLIASARSDLAWTVESVALVPGRAEVVLASRPPLIWRY